MKATTEDVAGPAADDPAETTPVSPAHRFIKRYTAALAQRILHELENGRSLNSICHDDGVPAYATVYGWVVRDVEGFAARYARACQIGGRRGARSIQYSTELGERILREIESGRSLHDVCRDDGMPGYKAALGWTARLREFAARYHRARAIGNPRHGGEVLYTDALAERVLAALASGRTLHDICLDDDMPSQSTVQHWVNDDRAGFCARYFAARDAGRARMGRPTLYSKELADRLLFELSDGRSLRDICRADGMPSRATIRLWVRQDRDGFAARYHEARACAEEEMMEQMLEIADDGRNDWTERRARDGRVHTVLNRENIQRSKLRWEARRWQLSSALPKKRSQDAAPQPEDEETQAWAAYMKLVNNKSRGLPRDHEPVDEAEWAAFLARFPGFPYGVGQRGG